jgi:hypothetical protein
MKLTTDQLIARHQLSIVTHEHGIRVFRANDSGVTYLDTPRDIAVRMFCVSRELATSDEPTTYELISRYGMTITPQYMSGRWLAEAQGFRVIENELREAVKVCAELIEERKRIQRAEVIRESRETIEKGMGIYGFTEGGYVGTKATPAPDKKPASVIAEAQAKIAEARAETAKRIERYALQEAEAFHAKTGLYVQGLTGYVRPREVVGTATATAPFHEVSVTVEIT